MNGTTLRFKHAGTAAAGCLLLTLGGCISIPAYDATTDTMLTTLQSSTDTLIDHLIDTYDATPAAGKACAYSKNTEEFERLRVTIGVMTTRADALYNNKYTLAALANLKDTYGSFDAAVRDAEQSRPDHCVLPQLLVADQRGLDSAVGAVLKLELAKTGGL